MSAYDVVEEVTAEDGTPFRVVIEYDQDCESPRDNGCPAGVIHVRTQTRYLVPQEASDVAGTSVMDMAIDDHDFPIVARWLRAFHGATTVLPLYSTGGSDFAFSTGDETDTPERGNYAGVTFDTPATRKATGITSDVMEHALATDVDEYATWARGEVFRWIIQRGEADADGDVDWDEFGEESVWGHIGEDYAREAARVGLDDFIRAYDTDHPGTDEDHELVHAETAGAIPTADAVR